MKRTVVFCLVALCAVSVLSLAEEEKKSKPPATVSTAGQFSSTPKPKTTTAKPTTTTVKPKTTTVKPKTTTVKPKTTTVKPNTTTIKPNTTTVKPNTTTVKPKTTTIKPNTTTVKPKTTTVKPKTTTVKPKTTTAPPSPQPTPSTNLTVGNYNVTKDKGICLMAHMALQIRLVTPKANGTFIVQPQLTKAQGSCQETTANITLSFKEGFIHFKFNKSVAENTVYVDALSFSLSYPLSKDAKVPYSASNTSVHLFPAKIGHSYSCKSESIYMGKGLYLDVDQDRMQAFNLTKSNEFGTSDPCAADQPDYRVAIAVGVTLLVLIVIVVVAYLLGRRKRTDGYQSL